MSERRVYICSACDSPCTLITDELPEGTNLCSSAVWTELDPTMGSGVLNALMHEQIKEI